jgi:hypothetical protein
MDCAVLLHSLGVKLPFDRDRMRERNLLDEADEIAQMASMTPEERFLRGLELSELALSLARSRPDGGRMVSEPLERKAWLWTLRRVRSSA